MKIKLLFISLLIISVKIFGAYYVNPTSGNDTSGNGSIGSPYKTITKAITQANTNNVAEVYVVAGVYDMPSINITTNCTNLVTVSPVPGGKVTFKNTNFRFIRFYNGANNIKITGFEIDGKSNTTDHWTILSNYVWEPTTFAEADKGAGIAINVEDATNITIDNNIIHDFYQKAINIENGRYVLISNNIIYNIALTSLSGGHGIMRQQGSGSFADADDTNKYRWDINSNLIFNVSQRIYSWVPSKGYMNMTLDEGKPILIDETYPNFDQNMKARITQNIVAYATIDGIRLKPTVNLEVSNNSVFADDTHADGITDTMAGTTFSNPFKGLKLQNNAVWVSSTNFAYELGDAASSTGKTISNNFAKSGTITPSSYATSISNLFLDPVNGNFQMASNQTYGVSSTIITNLMNKASSEGIVVKKAPWVTNHLKNVQTLLDAIPGIEDGVTGNETVFTDAGTYDRSDEEWATSRKAYYFSLNTTWKNANVSNANLNQRTELDAYDGKYEIIVPFEYSTWFENARALYGTNKRIRYGESVLSQNKILPTNSVYITEINSATDFHVTTSLNKTFTLDGDLKIKFNYTPVGNESFDFLIAKTINSNNTNGLFDNVAITGYNGTYTLTKVIEGGFNKLRLTLTSTTLSTQDFSKNQFKIYPNPSTKEGFYIDNVNNQKNTIVKIYNTIGQEIPFSFVKKENSIYCKPSLSISSGLYIVKIISENVEKSFKILIN